MTPAPGKCDQFTKNVFIVFAASSVANVFHLLFQLLIAHRFTSSEFASFNSLLALCTLLTSPLATLQQAISKFIAEFKARREDAALEGFFTRAVTLTSISGILTLALFLVAAPFITSALKIGSIESGLVFALMIGLGWFMPVAMGAAQGAELFVALSWSIITVGVFKLLFGYLFTGASPYTPQGLAAFACSILAGLLVLAFPLKGYFRWGAPFPAGTGRKLGIFLLPLLVSSLCIISLVSMDMILVKYLFDPAQAGYYALAQMIGKILLYLPGSIVVVMFPKTAGLKCLGQDTRGQLTKSLTYTLAACILAAAVYNAFPEAILRILTGKDYPYSVLLGRWFSGTMTLLTIDNLLVAYLLSVGRTKFIPVLVAAALAQAAGIMAFHPSLASVQAVTGIVALGLMAALLREAYAEPEVKGL